MSLPNPDFLHAAVRHSLIIGMWSLTQTQPEWISLVARSDRHTSRVHADAASP